MTSPPRSLRRRLLAGTLIWVALALIGTGWALSHLFSRHVTDQFDAALGQHLDQLTAAVLWQPDGRPSLRHPLSDPRLTRPYGGLYWQLDREAPTPATGLLRSRSLWDHVLDPTDTASQTDGILSMTGPDGQRLRALVRTVSTPDSSLRWRLVMAADEQPLQAARHRFNGLLALALTLLGAGLLAAVMVQVTAGLRPLNALQRDLARIRQGRQTRLNTDVPAELAPLVERFNQVLEYNARIVERARTETGNLAHALKTPMAVLSNAAESASGPLAELVREQVQLARRQLEHHLARARARASAQQPGQQAPLASALRGLLRAMSRLHAEAGLTLDCEPIPAAATVAMDLQDLQEMLGNLLDNACKWARHRIRVSVQGDGSQWQVHIEDDGPGLAPEERDAALRRGVRLDERTPGSGLGLSIVTELVDQYGGALALDASPLGGVRATLSLPAAADLSEHQP